MARIRTIKPEFFTSEDVTSLTPLARLLYIALWCESDRKGRLEWKPGTFKMRYLPADNCDISALCRELLCRGVVVLYGQGLAFIPQFEKHQQINNREQESRLPEPKVAEKSRVTDATLTRDVRVTDAAEGKGREGKGRERNVDSSSEESASASADLLGPVGPDDCPQKALIALYHEVLPQLPPVNEWTDKQAKNLRTRWRSKPERQTIDWWRGFFGYVGRCRFLMGEKTDFQACLGWLVKAENFAKVLNGQYEDRAAA
jgi:hypothetical protein